MRDMLRDAGGQGVRSGAIGDAAAERFEKQFPLRRSSIVCCMKGSRGEIAVILTQVLCFTIFV